MPYSSSYNSKCSSTFSEQLEHYMRQDHARAVLNLASDIGELELLSDIDTYDLRRSGFIDGVADNFIKYRYTSTFWNLTDEEKVDLFAAMFKSTTIIDGIEAFERLRSFDSTSRVYTFEEGTTVTLEELKDRVIERFPSASVQSFTHSGWNSLLEYFQKYGNVNETVLNANGMPKFQFNRGAQDVLMIQTCLTLTKVFPEERVMQVVDLLNKEGRIVAVKDFITIVEEGERLQGYPLDWILSAIDADLESGYN